MRHPAFSEIEHRPWAPPGKPWLLQQEWLDLLFVHWEADADELRARLPEGIELDTYEGKAWLGVVAFRMKGVAPRLSPKPATLCDFPEINVRTYVKRDCKAGVWFFSLDVPKRLPVWLARSFFHLPYFYGKVAAKVSEAGVCYDSEVSGRRFVARYRGLESYEAEKGSFEAWSSERYCFYCNEGAKRLYRCEIQHEPWPLMRAELELRENTMLNGFSVGPMHPSVLYSQRLPVVAWWPERLR